MMLDFVSAFNFTIANYALYQKNAYLIHREFLTLILDRMNQWFANGGDPYEFIINQNYLHTQSIMDSVKKNPNAQMQCMIEYVTELINTCDETIVSLIDDHIQFTDKRMYLTTDETIEMFVVNQTILTSSACSAILKSLAITGNTPNYANPDFMNSYGTKCQNGTLDYATKFIADVTKPNADVSSIVFNLYYGMWMDARGYSRLYKVSYDTAVEEIAYRQNVARLNEACRAINSVSQGSKSMSYTELIGMLNDSMTEILDSVKNKHS